MMAASEGFYGPQNPFLGRFCCAGLPVRNFQGARSPLRIYAHYFLWEFEAGILPLITRPLPSITARHYIRARETLLKVYVTYCEKKGYEDPRASALVRNRATQ